MNNTLELHEIPMFSVLDTRQGRWQKRKSHWLSYGIESEVGRTAKVFRTKDWVQQKSKTSPKSDTSIFDPVLCELMYHWFCPRGGKILDPFAGGSVRGIVAGLMGMHYDGIDLRQEQIEANIIQRNEIIKTNECVEWYVGDSVNLNIILPGCTEYDFIFSCPPYGDLEVYSDDPKDLSNMELADFTVSYKDIIYKAVQRLKDCSFACFVVGNYRHKQSGTLIDLVGLTNTAFRKAGANYYNEMILVNVAGTLPFRVGAQMYKSRKIGRCHQSILVFVKGDPFKAAQRINEHGNIEFKEQETNLEELFG